MKILRIELENYKRIYNGLGRNIINILFNEGIIHLSGPNGIGKSTILNALSPLPDSKDEIIPGKDGIKKVKIEKDGEIFEVRYVYPFDGKATRGYITNLNTETELIENGNITACKEMVFDLFGLDNNYETLSRLSAYSNKVSFAMMRPADRKKYMSNIIGNLEVYANIYKELSKRSTTFKAMIGTISDKISSTGYKTPQDLEVELMLHQKQLEENKKKKDAILIEIGKYSNIQDKDIKNMKKKEDLQKVINDLSINIERNSKSVEEKLSTLFPEESPTITSSEVLDHITKMEKTVVENEKLLAVYNVEKDKATAENTELSNRVIELEAKVDRNHVVFTDKEKRNKEIDLLKGEIESNLKHQVPAFAKDCEVLASVDMDAVREVLSNAFNENPLADPAVDIKDFVKDDSFDMDGMIKRKHIKYEDIKNNNGDYVQIVTELDVYDHVILNSATIIQKKKLLDSYYSMLKNLIPVNFEDYHELKSKRCNRETFVYAYSNGVVHEIGNLVDTAKNIQRKIDRLKNLVERQKSDTMLEIELKSYISEINMNKEKIDKNATIIKDRYLKIQKLEEETDKLKKLLPELNVLFRNMCSLESTKSEFHKAKKEINLLNIELTDKDNNIKKVEDLKANLVITEQAIETNQKYVYNLSKIYDSIVDYINELNMYKTKNEKVEILKKYSSSTTGIQTVFVDMYMNKILEIANRFLQRFFNGRFMLQPFVINENEFRIPVMTDGLMIDDISSMSASQVAMVNLCLSFAILYHSSKKYNIIRLDEIDNALDTENRILYPIIIDEFMHELGSKQCFVVSHNSEGFSKKVEMEDGMSNITEIDLGKLKEGISNE